MELTDYIKHINQEENGKIDNSEYEEDTIDESIENILKLKNIAKENKKISYKIKF